MRGVKSPRILSEKVGTWNYRSQGSMHKVIVLGSSVKGHKAWSYRS